MEELSDEDLLKRLTAIRKEAETARKTGPNPVGGRDDVWKANRDLYWGRIDFSGKAEWQSKEKLPEAPMFVDRFAAAMREALYQSGTWYTPEVAGDESADLTPLLRKFMNYYLAQVGRAPNNVVLDFGAVFEDLMKAGTMATAAAAVTWQVGQDGIGYVGVDTLDSLNVWFDATGRRQYRIRRKEVDLHTLRQMAKEKGPDGRSFFKEGAMDQLIALKGGGRALQGVPNTENASGNGADQSSRNPVVVDEFLGTIYTDDGEIAYENSLVMVAEDRVILRGPEENPFWHKQDWVVATPLITVPLSVYGRTYMENWSDMARTYIELTNLLIDAGRMEAMHAFVIQASNLADPSQATEGVSPNKTFVAAEGADPTKILHKVELGSTAESVFKLWAGLKQEMREGAAFNELALGQLPPKGDITATEVLSAQEGSTALVRSLAKTTETRLLEPVLNLIFRTALQHFDEKDPDLLRSVGQEGVSMLAQRREEFVKAKISFRVRGISGVIAQSEQLRNLIALLRTVGQIEPLAQAMLQTSDMGKMWKLLVKLHGVDPQEIAPDLRQQQMAGAMAAMGVPVPGQAPAAPGKGGGGPAAEVGTRSASVAAAPPAPPPNQQAQPIQGAR